MAFLVNKPQANDGIQLYSMSQSKTIIVVGLGNPGKEYDLTRHNVGFMAVDAFVDTTSEMSGWSLKKDLKCLHSSGQLGQTRVIAMKPTTFMNLSGEAVHAVAAFYKVAVDSIVVLHDELDITFGQIRLRVGGSDAGNNGIKSLTQHLGEEFGRMRIGIGPKKPAAMDSADFVLQKFAKAEQAQLPNLYLETTAIINEYVYGGQLPHETRSFII